MLTLTKQQRNQVYREAKRIYTNDHFSVFLCDVMNIALDNLKLGGVLNPLWVMLPEFWAFKPPHVTSDWASWWPSDDIIAREKCIDECIKLTEDGIEN